MKKVHDQRLNDNYLWQEYCQTEYKKRSREIAHDNYLTPHLVVTLILSAIAIALLSTNSWLAHIWGASMLVEVSLLLQCSKEIYHKSRGQAKVDLILEQISWEKAKID